MRSLFTRLILFISLSFLFAGKALANDSDVVNCNHVWTVVVLGSSTAYGTGATVYDSSWVGRYTAYLLRKNANNIIYNLGIPGFTTYQNLCPTGFVPPANRPSPNSSFNITAALDLHPDALIINMPSNDAANDYTVAEQQANFERAMHLADSANVPVWVTTTQPRNNMSGAQIANLIAMRDWITSRFGSKSVDFWSTVANGDGSIATFYDFDDVHMNNQGHNLFYKRIKAETILDSLCIRVTPTLIANAGNDISVTLPVSSTTLDGSGSFSSLGGIITNYQWQQVSAPIGSNAQITSPTNVTTPLTNLTEGRYSFSLTVTDNSLNVKTDTVNVVVSSRILIEFGPDITTSPDGNGNTWNSLTTARTGDGLSNVVTTGNAATTIGLLVVNRIDGTFNVAGPGTNTGNTTGAVGDYPSTATSDFAFAEPSATNGQWRITGLESTKQYTIKFWGSRSVTDDRIIQIKRADQSTWQEYNATGNTNYSTSAIFTFSGKTQMTFDIKVKAGGSAFGYISVIDITRTSPLIAANVPPNAIANDVNVALPATSGTLDGSLSSDDDGNIVSYQWIQTSGPSVAQIVDPGNAVTQVNNLIEGIYTFQLSVTDDSSAVSTTSITLTVNSRVLFDIGPDATPAPDGGGKYWNNVANGQEGVKITNAITTGNSATDIDFEIVHRIDGTFNTAGPGTNTGNTVGDLSDYPATATTDYAFAHPSATNGQWKLSGLDNTKQYTIKFWGSRTGVGDQRYIQIKRFDETLYQQYDATNNTDYNNAAVFTFTGQNEMLFDIKVRDGDAFGYIGIIDIKITNATVPCIPTVSIAANPATAICPGTPVTFTATPTNGGSAPQYQWLKGVDPIPGETGSTYTTSSALVNGDAISVVLTSNDVCASGAIATSNTIVAAVNPELPVSVSIAADPGNTVCDGTVVTFTATPTNGGDTPTYQWFNGASPIAGQTGSTYTSNTLVNGDAISVVLTSNATPCATGSPATSNTITMTVNPNLPVSVGIATNTGNVICDGTAVTFTASPTNGGDNPTYQWFNGPSPIIGETGSTYNTTTLINGDAISVLLASDATCAVDNPAISAVVTMTVNPNLPASVIITADPGNSICAGTSVTFTAIPTNGGDTPTYQWYNGATPIPGETNNTYTSAALVNGDAISVLMTSNVTPCVSQNPATSNTIVITILPNLPVSVSIAANPGNTICAGTSVTFTATPTNGGDTPTYQWFNGASPIVGETNSTYTSSALVNGDVISVVLTSNATPCATGNPATSNNIVMTVNPNLPVSVSIAADPGNTVCLGTSVTFTATPTNGGANPTYQWYSGILPIIGATSNTYTELALVNGESISVVMTSNALCATGSPATSNTIVMTVNVLAPVSVSIVANPGNTICAGTSVTFTATPANGGNNPTYQWFNGASPIAGETNSSYTTSSLVNGDAIHVVLTSSATLCATGNPATSNTITMTVNPNLPVSVSIAANPGNTICDGASVTFTATPTNGGNNPTYQWFNGASPIVGQTNSTYTSSNLINGDAISVVLTSNATPCATGNPATSNTIVMAVTANIPVSVSIVADPGNIICDGTSVTFTATPTNGGNNPTYQWFRGASPIVGETNSTYTTSTLANGDAISVVLTSNVGPCTSNNPATSNVIDMTVNPLLPVSVSIAADPGNVVCIGTTVTFTATPTNGGDDPSYQWYLNGLPITDETKDFYTTSSLDDGDVISVIMTSNAPCSINNPATSNTIVMTINTSIPVSVSIAANTGNTICDGTSVIFTATPQNGGNGPAYSWFNGTTLILGQVGSTYTTSSLVNNDAIHVVLTSNSTTCEVGNPATSNTIVMTVKPYLPVSVSISADPGTTICSGTSVTFTATPTNGGSTPTYQWYRFATPIVGATGSTYTSSTLIDGEVISVVLTSSEQCTLGNPATSNSLNMKVSPNLPVNVSIAANPGNVICNGTSVTFTATPTNGGAAPTYQWFNGASPIAGETGSTYTSSSLVNGDAISVVLTSSATNCTFGNPATSNTITMTVNPILPVSVSIAANPGNTICSGTSVTFTATPTNGGNNPAYQWFNGASPIVGETNSTYTSSSLVNGDAISVVLTSDATPCATGNPATSNTITMSVAQTLPVSVSIAANPGNTICDGSSVTFTATPTNGGSTPTYQWFNGASPIVGETGNTYTSSSLVNGDAISVVLTSSATECITGNPATSNTIAMTVNPNLPVSVSIAANPGNTICAGASVTFTATPTNGGNNPTYQWFNGASPIVGETGNTYTSSSLINGDAISVVLTSDATPCATGNPATSNTITMTVNANLPVSVSIAANPGNAICDGTSVTFTATPTNGGNNPTYQWFNGASPIVGETGSTYTSSSLVNDDAISVVLTSDAAPCATGSPATSNTITMSVGQSLPVSVSIAADPGNTICAGTLVIFTATPTNGGNNPTYQWFNGASPIVGETSSTYTSTTLVNGDAISVVLTSSATACITGNPATSNTITMTVNPNLPVSVSIAANPGNTICVGASVTFTATPINGGNNPTYQWYNGASLIIGETADTYTSSSLVNGDAISVVLASTATTCISGSPATSNTIIMTVNPNLPVSVSIAANPGNTICSGTSVTFTATPTNGGNNPTYQWFNGASPIIGETNSTYTSSALIDGDAISVVLTSNASPCATGSPATSNTITMSIVQSLPVSVSIAANPGNTICSGTSVTFTATPTNGGNNPTYQWFNGASAIVGETGSTYTSSSLVNGDAISVVLTSSATACITGNPATSNTITMTVNPNLPVSVSIAANAGNTICAGTSVTFTATPTNGGGSPTYQWFNGASAIVGETGSTYTSSSLVNGDAISVVLTSSATTCITGNPATSNTITMTVNPNLPVSVSIAANPGNTICTGTSVTFTATPINGGNNPTYQWFNGASPIVGQTGSTYTSSSLANGDAISVVLTSNASPCATGSPATSNTITMSVGQSLPVSVSIAANPGNTICAGTSVTFTATPTNGGGNPTYQWFNGVSPIAGEIGSTYTSSSLVNGDAIHVVLTSSATTCVTGNPATSNTITITVNQNLPVSVSIAANPGNTICSGISVTFTATPTNGGNNPSYQWFNGVSPIVGQTGSTYTSSALADGDAISVVLTSNATCVTGSPATSNTITMSVGQGLPVSVSIAANPGNVICPGTSVTFTATPVNAGVPTTYQWKKNGSDINGATNPTYTDATLVNNDVISCTITTNTSCANGVIANSNNITIVASSTIPTTPVAINGPTNACPFVGQSTTATYSIAPVANATSYTWTVPAGASIASGQGSTSIEVSYSNSFLFGSIKVVANAGCGSSNPRSLSISKVGPLPPGSISGPTSACPYLGNGTQAVYSIAAVLNATSYTWTLPANVNLISGQGTTSITVTYDASFASGSIQVKSVSNCSTSLNTSINITTSTNQTPGVISGPTNACPFIGSTDQATYTINMVPNATSYVWTVPAGVTITSHPGGAGVNDTIITVSYDNGFVSGTKISVQSSGCVMSSMANLTIVRSGVPAAPTVISGPTNACAYVGTANTATYTIPKVVNASYYNWTLPANASATHPGGNGSNDTIIVVTYAAGFSGGAITVSSGNGCGSNNVVRSISINVLGPTSTPVISGPTDPCVFIGTTGATYTINKILYATSYTWTVPAVGATAIHPNGPGINDTVIIVNYTSDFTTGNITCRADANCGSSSTRSLALVRKMPSIPSVISTTLLNACPNRRYQYSIAGLPTNATSATWTVPAGATIFSGQGTATIVVDYPPTAISASVSVIGVNACGNGPIKNTCCKFSSLCNIVRRFGCDCDIKSYL
ncbi:MAG: GDSL-type esterase/lipase family protein [Ferruginibacter sp.]